MVLFRWLKKLPTSTVDVPDQLHRLTWLDPLCADAYQLEIISTAPSMQE